MESVNFFGIQEEDLDLGLSFDPQLSTSEGLLGNLQHYVSDSPTSNLSQHAMQDKVNVLDRLDSRYGVMCGRVDMLPKTESRLIRIFLSSSYIGTEWLILLSSSYVST